MFWCHPTVGQWAISPVRDTIASEAMRGLHDDHAQVSKVQGQRKQRVLDDGIESKSCPSCCL